MAGMGFVGAGGAAGTYEGLRDWMQGRRQKVVQGQRDEDRLREQALQNQALATEAADREYDMARQRVIDERAGTTFQNQQTEFAQGQTAFQQEQSARLTPEQMADVFSQIDASDQLPGLAKIGLKLNIQKTGSVPRESWELFAPKAQKTVKVETVKNGRPVNMYLPEDQVTGQTFEEYRAPVQGPADNVIAVKTVENGREVVKYMPQSQASGRTFEQAPKGKGGADLTGKQRDTLGRVHEGRRILEQLKPLFDGDATTPGAKEFIGPWEGWARGKAQGVGVGPINPQFAKFKTASARMKNATIQAITGAAVGVEETKRLIDEIPTELDHPDLWPIKYEQSLKNLRYIEEGVLGPGGGTTDAGPVTIDVARPPTGGGGNTPQRGRFNPATGEVEW